MNVILSECHPPFPQAGLGGWKSEVPVVRMKEIVAALLRASDTFLIRSQPLPPGCTDHLSIPSALIFLRVAVGSNHTDEVASSTVHG